MDGIRPRTPLFGLAPGGVCRAAACCHPRGALLPHHFTLTDTNVQAVYFLWHFPWVRTLQVLPGALPDGARTFLRASLKKPGDCLADSHFQIPLDCGVKNHTSFLHRESAANGGIRCNARTVAAAHRSRVVASCYIEARIAALLDLHSIRASSVVAARFLKRQHAPVQIVLVVTRSSRCNRHGLLAGQFVYQRDQQALNVDVVRICRALI